MKNNAENILIIGSVWPEPNSSAAGKRMLQLMDVFLSNNARITFATAANESVYAFDVKLKGVHVEFITLNAVSFDHFILKLQPTIVLFDRFPMEEQFGWRVAKNCPLALRILDTEDLHCLRNARHEALKQERDFVKEDLFSEVAKREIASILRCDLTLMISTYEMKLLQSVFKIDIQLLLYIPFLLDPIPTEVITQWAPFEDRKGFIFVGNFLHEPNWNAILFLKQEIWPLIRKKILSAELFIYGAYTTPKVMQLNNEKEGFYCLGRVLDSEVVVSKSRVCIAPLRFGAGLKGKLLEAMVCGTPSCTTRIGSEGMHGTLEWSGLIGDSAVEIAENAVELYQNKALWKEKQTQGIRIVESEYSKVFFGNTLLQRMEYLTKNLSQLRAKNFIGSLLLHHTMDSTRYKSQWIEEKNKN